MKQTKRIPNPIKQKQIKNNTIQTFKETTQKKQKVGSSAIRQGQRKNSTDQKLKERAQENQRIGSSTIRQGKRKNSTDQKLKEKAQENQRVDSSAIRQGQRKNSTVQTFEERARENQRVVSQGAEATIYLKNNLILKKRISKEYRIKELDSQIIKIRTRAEAKILEKARQTICCPKIIDANENAGEILIEYIKGKRISEYLNKISFEKQKDICKKIAKQIFLLHKENIAHNDLTTSNMIYNLKTKEVFLIDFGLSFQNAKYEDKAVDLHLLKKALEAKHWRNWETLWKIIEQEYQKQDKIETIKILERLKAVEKRGRYKH